MGSRAGFALVLDAGASSDALTGTVHGPGARLDRPSRYLCAVRLAPPALLVLLGALAFAAVPGGAARVKTFAPTGTYLRIDLPAGWRTVRADPGWRFKAVAPHFTAWTFLSARGDTVDRTSYFKSFVAFERAETASLGPHVVFRTHRAAVGTEPAVLVYAAGRGTMTEYFYGFVHRGVDYVLAFATPAEHAAGSKPLFEAAARSVRFDNP